MCSVIHVLKKKFLKRLIATSIEFLPVMAYCVVSARYVFFLFFYLSFDEIIAKRKFRLWTLGDRIIWVPLYSCQNCAGSVSS